MINQYPHHLEAQYVKIWQTVARAIVKASIPRLLKAVKKDHRLTTDDALSEMEDVRREIMSLINENRIQSEMERFASLLDQWSYLKTRESVEELQSKSKTENRNLSVDFIPAAGELNDQIDAFVKQNMALIPDLASDVVERLQSEVSAAIRSGDSVDSLTATIQETANVTASKAEFWARDQIGSTLGQLNATRQQDAGFSGYVWQTSHDERVRDSHRALQGRHFKFGQTPPGLDKPGAKLPGEDYQCRCTGSPSLGPHENAEPEIVEQVQAVEKPEIDFNSFVPIQTDQYKLLDVQKDWLSQIPDEGQKEALSHYTRSGYGEMNTSLRKGKPNVMADRLQTMIEEHGQTLDKTIPVYRILEKNPGWKVGDTFEDGAFTSASLSLEQIQKTYYTGTNRMRILVPPGTKFAFGNTAEQELIFNPGGIRIISQEKDGMYNAILE